ncbi:hypothetical protein V6N13_092310 [Hibiscus sabdariffa]|uniref:Uncharacterized protein n=2 Tax=Hibiscus sabdariffa TaxID=183260 RepID=A0ABR2CC25_9ROSI
MAAKGRKRAVLVGCNYPNTKFKLHGCINDVIKMRDLIQTTSFGFKEKHIKVLTDEPYTSPDKLPTHVNIMAALEEMVRDAKKGDVLFFHFSGHGTTIPSLEPGNAYREDEAIVPYMDLRCLIKGLDKDIRFTIVSDSCHSGGLIDKRKEQIGPSRVRGIPPTVHFKARSIPIETVAQCLLSTRSDLTATEDAIGARPKFWGIAIPAAVGLLGNILPLIFPKEVSIKFRPQHEQSALLISEKSLTEDEGILLSGCQANETSADLTGSELTKGEAHGAFTYALVQALKEDGSLTNKELVVNVRKILQKWGFEQHPCLYSSNANADAPFLATQDPSNRKERSLPVASRWRELSGEKNWEGLLKPALDPDLRRYLIQYSQRTAAVGDLFNCETDEPDASKEDFFSKACLVKGNPYQYKVTHFLYAGSDVVKPSWFGYVAVATDEGKLGLGRRDILVSWRGTSSTSEWRNNLNFIRQTSASDLFPNAEEHGATVHRGFHSLYTGTRPGSTHCKTSVRKQVLHAVKELVNRYKDEEISITVTGFSLGAALATLTAMDIVVNEYNKPTTYNQNKPFMVTAFTYGGPRVGNLGLARLFDTYGDQLHLLRIENEKDHVPALPPLSYTELGEKLIVNTSKSNYLKWKGPFRLYVAFSDENKDEDSNKRDRRGTRFLNEDEDEDGPEFKFDRGGILEYYSCHNIDVYAHGIAIQDIPKNTSIDELDHDLPLVNKHLDRAKNEFNIPPNWWADENHKEMTQLKNGRWRVTP